jgi:hypothetical protein
MVKNKEFEYCSWNQNEWDWNFLNVWIRPLRYAFLRHLESYYCILRWKNLIRGSFYKKNKIFFWSQWRPQWVGRGTGTTPIFLFGLVVANIPLTNERYPGGHFTIITNKGIERFMAYWLNYAKVAQSLKNLWPILCGKVFFVSMAKQVLCHYELMYIYI